MDDGRRRGVGEEGGAGSVCDSQAGAWLQLATDLVHVVHGSVEGEPYSFSDAGRVSLHQLDFVEHLIDPKGSHFGSRKPLPAALAVEEVDEEEFLCGPVLHPLADFENVQRRLGKLHPVVLTRCPPGSGVHDLKRSWQLW